MEAEVMEVISQVLVSLLLGVLLAIPIVWIYFRFRKWRLKKAGYNEIPKIKEAMKGGLSSYGNNKSEEKESYYATDEYLRSLSNKREFREKRFNGNETETRGRKSSVEDEIKLDGRPRVSSSADGNVGRDKQQLKKNWEQFD